MRTYLLGLLVLAPTLARADSIRCGSQLASEGATQVEVWQRCGEPLSKFSKVEVISDELKTKNRNGTSVGTVRTITRTIDEWTYNFGPTSFMQLVTFVDGRLVSVRSLGYGR